MAEEVSIRSNILEELSSVKTSDSTQIDLVKQANSAYGLLSSIPMVCKTKNCPYASVCPLQRALVAVTGDRCPIEADLIKNMFVSYCRELDINPDYDKVQAGLVKDLCSVEIQAVRANKLMGFEDFIVDSVEAIDPSTGKVYFKKDLHIAVTWSERLLNQKIRILDTLAATPLIRAKYMGGEGKQTLLDKVNKLKARVEELMPKEEEESKVYEVDDWRIGEQ